MSKQLPQLTERTYRYVVTFEPDRPMKPRSYTREVCLHSLYPGDAVRAALDKLTMDDVTLWQAEEVVIRVRRTA